MRSRSQCAAFGLWCEPCTGTESRLQAGWTPHRLKPGPHNQDAAGPRAKVATVGQPWDLSQSTPRSGRVTAEQDGRQRDAVRENGCEVRGVCE